MLQDKQFLISCYNDATSSILREKSLFDTLSKVMCNKKEPYRDKGMSLYQIVV